MSNKGYVSVIRYIPYYSNCKAGDQHCKIHYEHVQNGSTPHALCESFQILCPMFSAIILKFYGKWKPCLYSLKLTACHVDPAVNSDFSSRSTSFRPYLDK